MISSKTSLRVIFAAQTVGILEQTELGVPADWKRSQFTYSQIPKQRSHRQILSVNCTEPCIKLYET